MTKVILLSSLSEDKQKLYKALRTKLNIPSPHLVTLLEAELNENEREGLIKILNQEIFHGGWRESIFSETIKYVRSQRRSTFPFSTHDLKMLGSPISGNGIKKGVEVKAKNKAKRFDELI